MKHFHSFEETHLENAWATIGVYDGVHRGHQAILKPLAEEAHAAGSPAVVVTFFPHPVVVLRGASDALYLTSPDERAALLGELGIDAVLTLNFTRELAGWTADLFMEKMSAAFGLRQLWVGQDFALGRNRHGDLPTLSIIGENLGYTLRVTEDVRSAGNPSASERISSSLIRTLVREGRVEQAAQMLGRYYALEGPVVSGHKRGRDLGFPTANVAYWEDKICPAYGVYATWSWVDGKRIPSVTSVGVRPTFDPPGSPARAEAYLIDFDGDLYGKKMRLDFVKFLRPELRFNSAQTLIDQMVMDTQHAREVLADAA